MQSIKELFAIFKILFHIDNDLHNYASFEMRKQQGKFVVKKNCTTCSKFTKLSTSISAGGFHTTIDRGYLCASYKIPLWAFWAKFRLQCSGSRKLSKEMASIVRTLQFRKKGQLPIVIESNKAKKVYCSGWRDRELMILDSSRRAVAWVRKFPKLSRPMFGKIKLMFHLKSSLFPSNSDLVQYCATNLGGQTNTRTIDTLFKLVELGEESNWAQINQSLITSRINFLPMLLEKVKSNPQCFRKFAQHILKEDSLFITDDWIAALDSASKCLFDDILNTKS